MTTGRPTLSPPLSRAVVLAAALVATLTTGVADATEPNETFAQSTRLASGLVSVSDLLTPGMVSFPDTLLAIRNGAGVITQIDDNNSIFGDGFASGVTGAPTNGGDLFFTVTGAGDGGFSGAHDVTGEFDVQIEVFDAQGERFAAFFTDPRTLVPGSTETFQFDGPDTCPGCTYSANIDNTISEPFGGDVDFFTFTGLPSGAAFGFDVTPTSSNLETLAFRYDATGTIVDTDVFSRIEGFIPASGELTFAITGDNDFNPDLPGPDGAHLESGDYTAELAILLPDFNNNGVVDGPDLRIWELGLGVDARADADADGDTDGADFLAWQERFGVSIGASATAVPEPASLAILAAALVAGARARRS